MQLSLYANLINAETNFFFSFQWSDHQQNAPEQPPDNLLYQKEMATSKTNY